MSAVADDAGFELLLEYLRRSRGFDFTGYKRASLSRRIGKRMHAVGVTGYADYVDYLEVHPEEFAGLFDTILINVTHFFRNPAAWESLSAQVIPRIVASKRVDEPIRLWSAGCATGQEAYTLAMVMAEALGVEQFCERVKIYATDVDEGALTKARHAAFTEKEVHGVGPELLEKYFEPINGRYTLQKEFRRSVIFGRHDLIQDAPISRIDLLSCRNTLMYLNAETQARILDRLHFALCDRGFLFLGKAESLLAYNTAFVPVDLARRIFAKVPRGGSRERPPGVARPAGDDLVYRPAGPPLIRDLAFDLAPTAQVVVDALGLLCLANERARVLFNMEPSDIGRPLQDLQLSYRPAELRTSIDRAYAERKAIILKDVDWPGAPGESRCFDVHIVPLIEPPALLGAGITFFDTTDARRLAGANQLAHRELETAYEELQSTNEELETTNEELQSTVEELETTSEELQSTNEELETMNEELQSTNEELAAVNDELRRRSEELRLVNGFFESILSSLRGGVAVVDAEFLVQVWNAKAEDLWGLRYDEVRGRNLLNLDIGLPVERLKPALLECMAGDSPLREVLLDAVNRRGRPIACRVTCTPISEDGRTSGVIVMMEDETPAGSA